VQPGTGRAAVAGVTARQRDFLLCSLPR
jgi:hypothetical protein